MRSTPPCVLLLLLLLLAAPARSAPPALSTRRMNASAMGEPNQLPLFLPIRAKPTDVSDECGDELWNDLIVETTPVLPYRLRDGYDRAQTPDTPVLTVTQEVKETDAATAAVLTFYPESGGKLASVVMGGREILFDNPVLQPANLSRLNAWTSGGVEWNWPRLGHSVFTAAPVYMGSLSATLPGGDGDGMPGRGKRGSTLGAGKGRTIDVTRIWEFDRELNTTWQVDVAVANNTVWVHVKVNNRHNGTADPVDAYWWTNIGVPLDAKTRVLAPVDVVASNSPQGQSCLPFPNFDDCAASSDGWNWNGSTSFFPTTDHSYEHWLRRGFDSRVWCAVVVCGCCVWLCVRAVLVRRIWGEVGGA